MVTETFDAWRNRGHTRAHAIEFTARELGLTERRVRSYLNGEPVNPRIAEYERVTIGFPLHLDALADELTRRRDAARERRRALERGL